MTWPRLWCQYLIGYSSYCFVDLPPVTAEGSAVGEDVLEQAEDRLAMIALHHLRILCDVDGGMKECDACDACVACAGRACASGSDGLHSMMCLGQEMIWPFSVIAETAVELLWIDAKLFREVGMGSSEWTAGFS